MTTRLIGFVCLWLTSAAIARAGQAPHAAPPAPAAHPPVAGSPTTPEAKHADAAHEAPETKTATAKKPNASHDTPAPAKTTAAAGKDVGEHAPPTKKKPVVSRVAPPVAPPAAPAVVAHAPATPAPVAAGAHAPSSTSGHGGYVATGARPKSAAPAKVKPVVSGLAARPADAHTTGAPERASATHGSPASAPAESGPDGATTPSAEAGHGDSAPERPATRGLARLTDVHERIAAALASLREDTGRSGGRDETDAHDDVDTRGRSSRAARVTLRWPPPRWRVEWPQAPGAESAHAALRAPQPEPPPLVAGRATPLPVPSPVSAQPPERH